MKAGFETRIPDNPEGGKTAFVPPSVEQLAPLFPQLEILQLLGQGGMGAVYKARQPALDRFVALKILPPKCAENPGFVERFNREARTLARLNHPNIVALYDFGQAGEMPYFLMEYVDGVALRQVEKAGKLAPREALQIVLQICEALQFAHDEGVVHRDIKPDNILVDKRGRVKIADFGIAKILDPAPENITLTSNKDLVGTTHYMAPEQIENPQAVDQRADIFSLGVVFYELLTGELPIGRFQPPSRKVQVDVRLDEVVLHALEKEPERRYQTASQVRTDVAAIAASPGKSGTPARPGMPVPPVGVPPKVPPSYDKGPIIIVALLTLALLGLLLLVAVAILAPRFKTSRAASGVGEKQTVPALQPNDFSNLLNAGQRAMVKLTDEKFEKYLDKRTFDGWSEQERNTLERRLIDTLRGRRTDEYYEAIDTLAALHSTNALPVLRRLAFSVVDESGGGGDFRARWLATRALGRAGDRSEVPNLISLLYCSNLNTRWWAQISLVRLTGQNFGGDWEAWGRWWNLQHGQPPYNPQIIRWWSGQVEPEELAQSIAEADRKFLSGSRIGSASRNDDAFWVGLDRRNVQRYREQLQKAPHVVVVRPTHYDFNQFSGAGIGMHYGWLDGKLANLCIGFSELVSYGYTKDAVWDPHLMVRTEFPEEWRQGRLTNQFDVIITLRVAPVARGQAAIKQLLREQFGLSWHREMRETDVLLIQVRNPQLLESHSSRVFADSFSMRDLTGSWENYFGKPVLDETGLTNRYQRGLDLIPAAYVPNRTKDLDANNAFLARWGLELVPARRPMEWLALTHAKTTNDQYVEAFLQGASAEIVSAMTTNDFVRAQSLAEEMEQQQPQLAEAWFADGMASMRLGQMERARRNYEQALSLEQGRSRKNPSDAGATIRQIVLLSLLDRSGEAEALLGTARKSYPDDDQLANLAQHFAELKAGWTNLTRRIIPGRS